MALKFARLLLPAMAIAMALPAGIVTRTMLEERQVMAALEPPPLPDLMIPAVVPPPPPPPPPQPPDFLL